jgi:uncharacterized protein YjbI with pentapeptide repeats
VPRSTRTASASRGDKPVEPRLPPDLIRVDLAGITIGEWDGVELTGQLPDGFDEPLLLTGVRLHHASLVGARLEGSRLVDVAVVASELSGVDLEEASLTRVAFSDSRLSGAVLAQMRMRDVRFTDCRLDDVNVAMATGERVRFERCRLERADFRAARLEAVAWWDCDLTDAEFSQVQVVRAQLHGSTLDGLRGAVDLKPIGIDATQFPVIAEHLLATMGITVVERDEA